MLPSKLTRRDVVTGIAASSLFPFTSLNAASSREASAESGGEADASALCFTSAVEMAALIRAKRLSAREALAEHLKQIERVNPKVNAIVTLVAEMATADAARADEMQARGEKLGPLHGLP